VLGFISSRYSREAGLRNFERDIAAILRRRARKKADGEQGAWIVDNAMVIDILGNPRYSLESAEQEPEGVLGAVDVREGEAVARVADAPTEVAVGVAREHDRV